MAINYDRACLLVWPEWGSSGIWHPEKRGQPSPVIMVSHEIIGLPAPLSLRFEKWIDWFDDAMPGDDKAKSFDHDAFDREGLALAHALAEFAGNRFSVEYRGKTVSVASKSNNRA